MIHPPEVSDFLPTYPTTGDVNFNKKYYKKNEFYSLRLDRVEDAPSKGALYKHQKIIQRFLSPETLNDAIILDWEMGAGKTCGAFGVTENLKKHYKGALIFTKGPKIADSLMADLVETCSAPGQYNIEVEENEEERLTKIKQELKVEGFYRFTTYNFFEKLGKMSKEQFDRTVSEYSRYIFIIDEVHNLREETGSRKYTIAKRFFHSVKNCKKIIMSGTPMKDQPNEIAAILNLVLPMSRQVVTGESFDKEFLDETGKVKESKRNKLKGYMRGVISYIRMMESDVEKKFMGEPIGKLKVFKVWPSEMSDYQTKHYLKAYNLDQNTKSSKRKVSDAFDSESRQATLFVFPEAEGLEKPWGKEGYSIYVDEVRNKFKYNLINKIKVAGNYGATLENIRKYSTMYASIIENILQNPDKPVWVYDSLVVGSGAIVLANLLDLFNFTKATGKENTAAKRYILATGDLDKTRLSVSRKLFNSEKNMTGEYIQVFIGSKVLMEGFNLKNVQLVHIATPHWNYSETSQAIARALRLNSHEDLIKNNITPVVEIYQHVALPRGHEDKSVDLRWYEISEGKDIAIKSVERLIKEASWDCSLFYKRNRIYDSNMDNTRECDYKSCDFKCDGIPDEYLYGLSKKEIDFSTFDVYYLNDMMINIVDAIREIFKNNFSYFVINLAIDLRREGFNDFQIFSAVQKMIVENITIYNKNGFESFLREDRDVLFLVDSISAGSKYSMSLYSKHPVVVQPMSFTDAFDNLVIDRMNTSETQQDFDFYSSYLPSDVVQSMKSLAATASEDNIFKQRLLSNVSVPTVEVVSELEFEPETHDNIPYPLFGLISKTQQFKLRKTVKPGLLEIIKKMPTKKECMALPINELVDMGMFLQAPIPDEIKLDKTRTIRLNDISEDELETLLNQTPNSLDMLVTLEEKKRALYLLKLDKKSLCDVLKKLTDRRKIGGGLVCMFEDIKDISLIAIRLKIPYGTIDDTDLQGVSEEKLNQIISRTPHVKKLIADNNLTDLEDKKRAVYFMNYNFSKEFKDSGSKTEKEGLCEMLKQWFKSQNLLFKERSKEK
jgi:hypothetical protein